MWLRAVVTKFKDKEARDFVRAYEDNIHLNDRLKNAGLVARIVTKVDDSTSIAIQIHDQDPRNYPGWESSSIKIRKSILDSGAKITVTEGPIEKFNYDPAKLKLLLTNFI